MVSVSVLIVDDDDKLTKLLQTYFDKEGFSTFTACNGDSAIEMARKCKPDIIVLDLMLPGIDGFEVCKILRKESDVPVLMLTARDDVTDRLIGLEIGADDYVTKPFSPREVVARAKAILRRTRKTEKKQAVIRAGNILIDVDRHQASKEGAPLDLTPTEFKILEFFSTNPHRALSRLQIVEQVQGFAFDGYERTIDAHVKNLRRKIEDNPKEPRFIHTVYGVGYKFSGDDNE